MLSLMLALKEAEINALAIPVHMHHKHIATKHLKDKSEIPIVMVHAGHINETTALSLLGVFREKM